MKSDSIFMLCLWHSSSSRGWKSPLLSTSLPSYKCVLDLLHSGTSGTRTPPASQTVIHWPVSWESVQGSKRSSAPRCHPMCCPESWNIPYVKMDLLPPLHLFLLYLQEFYHCISKAVRNEWEEMHEAIFQIRAFFTAPCPSHQLLPARGAAAVRSDPIWSQKEPSQLSLPVPTKAKHFLQGKHTLQLNYKWGLVFLRGTNRRHSPYC